MAEPWTEPVASPGLKIMNYETLNLAFFIFNQSLLSFIDFMDIVMFNERTELYVRKQINEVLELEIKRTKAAGFPLAFGIGWTFMYKEKLISTGTAEISKN